MQKMIQTELQEHRKDTSKLDLLEKLKQNSAADGEGYLVSKAWVQSWKKGNTELGKLNEDLVPISIDRSATEILCGAGVC